MDLGHIYKVVFILYFLIHIIVALQYWVQACVLNKVTERGQLKIAKWKMLQSIKTAGYNPPMPVPLSLSSCRWQYSAILLQTILYIWYIFKLLCAESMMWYLGLNAWTPSVKINRLSFTTILLSGTRLCWIKSRLFFLFHSSGEGSTLGVGLKTSVHKLQILKFVIKSNIKAWPLKSM